MVKSYSFRFVLNKKDRLLMINDEIVFFFKLKGGKSINRKKNQIIAWMLEIN